MCSTFKYRNVMGRNYDYERSYDEEVIFVPKGKENNLYPILGIGSGLYKDYPMLYDGMNSKGLCMSGLAFTGNAYYHEFDSDGINIAPYELIIDILGHCESVEHFIDMYSGVYDLNIVDEQYNEETPNAELHWFLCDKEQSIVIESTKKGTNIYPNELGVMTNNPPFPSQKDNFNSYKRLVGHNLFPYGDEWNSRGRNTDNLSGGYSSNERFERLAYLKPLLEQQCKLSPIGDAFKLCSSIEQLYGVTPVDDKYEYTIYKAVYDMDKLELWVRTYDESKFNFDFKNKDNDNIQRWKL